MARRFLSNNYHLYFTTHNVFQSKEQGVQKKMRVESSLRKIEINVT